MGKSSFFSWPFLADDWIGLDPDPNVTELEIIGGGMPRTGTASLQRALVMLGFGPCHHAAAFGPHPDRSLKFIEALKSDKPDWRSVMRGYRSTVDGPTNALVPELLAAFPNAKVILTVRDSPEVWKKSMLETLLEMDSKLYFFSLLVFRYLRLHARVSRLTLDTRMIPLYGPDIKLEVYSMHNDYVRSVTPPEKLLEFNVKDGWEPLCKFLGVPVPDVPFPKTNESASLRENMRKTIVLGMTIWAGYAALLAVGGWCTYRWWTGRAVGLPWTPWA